MGLPRYTFDFSSWNTVHADRWDCANLNWNRAQAHLDVYPTLFYTPDYKYNDFIKYDTFNFSTAPTIQGTIINNHYRNLEQGGRGFFDHNKNFSFDLVFGGQYSTPPVYAPGYGIVPGNYNPYQVSGSNSSTTPETAEENNAKKKYEKLSKIVEALVKCDKLTDDQKAGLEVALKGKSENKNYIDKYNFLKTEYDKVVKDDRTRSTVKKYLIKNGLGTGNSTIVSASSPDSVYSQLLNIGYEVENTNMDENVRSAKSELEKISKANPNSTLVVDVSKDNVLDFISSWNNSDSTEESFILTYKKAVKDVDDDDLVSATKALGTVIYALNNKAKEYSSEDSVLDDATKTKIRQLGEKLEKQYKSGKLGQKDFDTLNNTYNELYVAIRLASARILGNELAKSYGAIDSKIFNTDMFVDETKNDLNSELNGKLKVNVTNDTTKISSDEIEARKKEAEDAEKTLKDTEKSDKNNTKNNEITETNFKNNVAILISNGDIKKSTNTVKIDGKDENIYSQTVNGETKYYIISGTNFKEVENVTMDSTGKASIEKDGENEKTPNVKDEEISAETLENNKQPEKDAKKATEGMTDTSCAMDVAGTTYTVYSLKTKDKETKYYIQMDNNFHEITGVTESKDGKISVANAMIENSATSATTVKEQVEEVKNAKPKLQELNTEEAAEAMNMAKDVHNAVNSSEFWNMFDRYGEIRTPLTKCSEKNVVIFYKEYLKINNNKFDLINNASTNSGLKNLLSAVKDLAKTFNITPENNEDLKLLVQYENKIGNQGLNSKNHQDIRIKLDTAFTNLMNTIINNSNS